MSNGFNGYRFIDIHYHANPDLYNRRLSAIEAGRRYKSLEGAVVLKSHLGSTSIQATLAQAEGLPVFPSLVLNAIAGGIDYHVILRALAEYHPQIPSRLLVHFPTFTGRPYRSLLKRTVVNQQLSAIVHRPETVFDGNGSLRNEVIDILKMSVDFPIVLSTGHASKEEVYALVDACERYNVPRFLLNQPANPLTGLNAKELLVITQSEKVWVEQTTLTYILGHQTKDDFEQVLKDVPRVLYSSDLGQASQMDIEDWYSLSNDYFNLFTLSKSRQAALWKNNAEKLLKLEN